jgi:hypothetical protein
MDRKEKWRKISVTNFPSRIVESQSINRKSTQGELKEFDQFEINDHTSPEEVVEVVNKFGEDKNGSKREVEKDKRKISNFPSRIVKNQSSNRKPTQGELKEFDQFNTVCSTRLSIK